MSKMMARISGIEELLRLLRAIGADHQVGAFALRHLCELVPEGARIARMQFGRHDADLLACVQMPRNVDFAVPVFVEGVDPDSRGLCVEHGLTFIFALTGERDQSGGEAAVVIGNGHVEEEIVSNGVSADGLLKEWLKAATFEVQGQRQIGVDRSMNVK